MEAKAKEVVVSGYFDPLHYGHIQLFREARKLGRLTVIVGTDEQLIGKKGFFFMPFEERQRIISALSCVDSVCGALDKDGTVRRTLKELKPDIFANGGDRTDDNIPEKEICEECGIQMVFGVGGSKSNSSSSIIQDGLDRFVKTRTEERPWGSWKILNAGPGFKIKLLNVLPGQKLSLQWHKKRDEHWVVISGSAVVDTQIHKGEELINLRLAAGESIDIPRRTKHRLENAGSDVLQVVEVSTGDYLKEDDIERFEDIYGRE